MAILSTERRHAHKNTPKQSYLTWVSNEYIISGGLEGKNRLNILSAVLEEYTHDLLLRNGLRPGTRFLDLGCGGGNVSRMAVAIVGNEGSVTAIDFDEEIIKLNKSELADTETKNLTYRPLSAYDLDYENEFDIGYSRFLLSHLKDPLAALKKLKEAVKWGGRIVVEDIHFAGHFSYPESPSFDEYVRLFTVAAQQRGQDPEIGPRLLSLFTEAGIGQISFDTIQPAFNNGDGKWMAHVTMDKIRNAVLQQGLADAGTIDRILQDLEAFTKDENTIVSLPRIFRVWGVKD